VLDDVSVFDRALSAPEVWARYTDSRQGYPQTLNRVSTLTVFDVGGGGGGGRTTFNTRSHRLGVGAGITWRVAS
jgi:hypothetical protein